MAHILVTGQTGQVGQAISRLQWPDGVTCEIVGRDQLDLSNPTSLGAAITAINPDIIINAAAYTAVDKAEDETDLAMIINGEAVGALAQAADPLGCPVVHISTDYVFDGAMREAGWSEDEEIDPINAYGASKALGEKLLREATDSHVIIRTAWVFSEDGNNFVKTMLRLGASRDHLTIIDDQFGGPTAARDIALACQKVALKLLENEKEGPFGTYHFAGAPSVTWCEFAGAIFEAADWLETKPVLEAIPTEAYPTPAKRPAWSVLDCRKIARDFDIEQPDWQEALDRVLSQLKPTS